MTGSPETIVDIMAAPSLMKRIQHRLEYVVVQLLFLSGFVMPLKRLLWVGEGIGWLGYHVIRIRRRVVLDNIRMSLPDRDEREVGRIALASYVHFGRCLMEFSAFKYLRHDGIVGMVSAEGQEALDRALAAGKGAILFSGHFGNWELLGAYIARCGYPVYATDTNHTNKIVHRVLVDLRRRQGMEVLAPSEPVKSIMRLLDENKFITYLADQNAGRRGVFVDFFGKSASTLRAPAVFAVRCGSPLVACFMIRDGTHRHRAVFEGPIWPDPLLEGEEAIVEFTQRFTRLLEAKVREHPEMYFWPHRRWKTRPPS